MPISFHPAIIVAAWLLLAGAPISPAAAQGDPEPSRTSMLTRVAKACTEEVARFCPDLQADAPAQDQLICLRPYRTSASLGCRAAINGTAR